MGWLTHEVGWSHVFFFMGGLGIVISFIWLKVIHEPNQHPGVNQKELEYIAAGGALINMDQQNTKVKVPFSVKWGQIKQPVSYTHLRNRAGLSRFHLFLLEECK